MEFCGPWVQPGERVSTHTTAEWGTIDTVFVAPVVINTEGRNFMIAHLKVGLIQIALGQEIRVIPKPGKKIYFITSHKLCIHCVYCSVWGWQLSGRLWRIL